MLSKYVTIAIPNADKSDKRVFVEYLPQKSTKEKMTKALPIEVAP